MMKFVKVIGPLIFCFFLHSCMVEYTVYLQPNRSKIAISEVRTSKDGEIIIVSSMDDLHLYKLYEPGFCNEDGYQVHKISLWVKQHANVHIELASVMVTECGTPLPISIFYEHQPRGGDPVLASLPIEAMGEDHIVFI